MPLVKIEIEKGQHKDFLQNLMHHTLDCLQEVLQLPAEDRNIRLSEYEKDFFILKPPYWIIIEIYMFSGRTVDTKRKLFQTIVERLEQQLNIKKEGIYLLIQEQARENWGLRGGIPACDIELGFQVEI